MPASNRFAMAVTAVDEFSPTFNKAKKGLDDLGRPIDDANKRFQSLGDNPALKNKKKEFDEFTFNAKDAFGAVGALIPAFETLAGVGSLLGGVNFVANWAGNAAALQRNAQMIGENVEQLQILQGANRLAGGSADDLTGALKALGDGIEGSIAGRNDTIRGAMLQWSIPLKRLANGAIDTRAELLSLADTYVQISKGPNGVNAANNFVRAFGIEQLVPLLRRGSQGIEDFENQIRRTGGIMSGEATEGATEFGRSLTRLEYAAGGTTNKLGELAARGLKPVVDTTAGLLETTTSLLGMWEKLGQAPPGTVTHKDRHDLATGSAMAYGAKPGDLSYLFAEVASEAVSIGTDLGGALAKQLGLKSPTAEPTPARSALGPDATRRDVDNETLRLLGNDRGAFLRENFTPPEPGRVKVDITLNNAPAGTIATVQQHGAVDASARVESSMSFAGP